jgi:hypothetical protein
MKSQRRFAPTSGLFKPKSLAFFPEMRKARPKRKFLLWKFTRFSR